MTRTSSLRLSAHPVTSLSLLPLVLFSIMISIFSGACSHGEGPYAAVEVKSDTRPSDELTTVKRFAFGSCNKQYLPQPLWKKIIADQPDLFLWTGDVVYADTRDMGKLSQIYASQLQQPEYNAFVKSGIPILGVWDDHDYGENNGAKDFPPKKKSQELFLDFLGEKKASPRRQQDGIYTGYSFGEGPESVRFLLLDTRSERTLATGQHKGDMLGDAQWQWLAKELSAPKSGVTFIVSSIQVLPFEQKFEKWENFPQSRAKLLDLIERSPSANIVLLSGDRHLAEASKLVMKGGRELWELTSSGMTHAFRNPDDKRNHNSLRVGPVVDRLNYGLIDVDFKTKKLRMTVRDLNGSAAIDQVVPLL